MKIIRLIYNNNSNNKFINCNNSNNQYNNNPYLNKIIIYYKINNLLNNLIHSKVYQISRARIQIVQLLNKEKYCSFNSYHKEMECH
jgi:hypothetical protein